MEADQAVQREEEEKGGGGGRQCETHVKVRGHEKNIVSNFAARTQIFSTIFAIALQVGVEAAGNAEMDPEILNPENWSDSDETSDESSADDQDDDGDNPPGGWQCPTS